MVRRALASSAFLAAAVLGGCSHVDVHSPSIRGVAYFRADEVMKHHPLYGQLTQIGAAMAAIDLESTLPHTPLTASDIDKQSAALAGQMRDAQNRAGKAVAQLQTQYGNAERDADAASLKAAGIDPRAAGIGQTMTAQSQQQAIAAAKSAQQGFFDYQKSVMVQDNAAMTAIAKQLNAEAEAKLRARQSQDAQQESDLSLRLAQQDAQQRLVLKTRLNTLALDPTARTSAANELNGLDKKEADEVAALRAQHAAELEAYRKQLLADTNAQIIKQEATMRTQTTAKLSAKRDEVGAQLRTLGVAPVPRVSIPPDVAAQLQANHQKYASQFQTDAQKIADQFNATKSDLDAQYAALHGQSSGATGASAAQLADLQKHYAALQTQMENQIQDEAAKLAQRMGFTLVLNSISAANGGYDLTNDLNHDIEGLHE